MNYCEFENEAFGAFEKEIAALVDHCNKVS